jgi:gliding motility-associated protein GldE
LDPEPSPFILTIFHLSSQVASEGIILNVLLFCVLLVGSALISGSEVAYFSLSVGDIRELEEDTSASAKTAIRLRLMPEYLLATILVINNFINIAIVLVSDTIFKEIIGSHNLNRIGQWLHHNIFGGLFSAEGLASGFNFFVTVVAVTFILVLFGEAIPKIYATVNKMKLVHFMAGPLSVFSKLLSPLNSILVGWTTVIEKRLKKNNTGSTSKEDLDTAIDLTVGIDRETSVREADILKGIVNFGDISAKQIMKSRLDVVALDIETHFRDVIKLVKESGFSRLPVYKDDLDVIKGILYVKDLISYADESEDFKWQNLIRKNILFIPESKKIDELLKEFQAKRTHMAIVVDEYGGVQGLATLEDIMEEVIGEIRDEFDQEDEVDYKRLSENHYVFDGKTLLNDVSRIIGLNNYVFESLRNDSDSLAGLILEMTGQLPQEGQELRHENLNFKILSVTQRRIEKISIKIDNPDEE